MGGRSQRREPIELVGGRGRRRRGLICPPGLVPGAVTEEILPTSLPPRSPSGKDNFALWRMLPSVGDFVVFILFSSDLEAPGSSLREQEGEEEGEGDEGGSLRPQPQPATITTRVNDKVGTPI